MAKLNEGIVGELERAWQWRESRGCFAEAECLRVFHGPGESDGVLKRWAVDRYGSGFWVTEWEGDAGGRPADANAALGAIESFLKSKGVKQATVLRRPEKGVPAEPQALGSFSASAERYSATEGSLKFWIQLLGARHPGLFLDHQPLRRWLIERAKDWKVLNTFAYTGSLSIAAGAAGASHVTTLDLSKPTVRWAEENWQLNGFEASKARFISGDVFEWLPRLKREGARYDCVILDPPSFSRGNKGSFSTAKDLTQLHRLAMELLDRDGVLVTSINSANVSWAQYEKDVQAAASVLKHSYEVLFRIDQPETFPSSFSVPATRYLKGWALRRRT